MLHPRDSEWLYAQSLADSGCTRIRSLACALPRGHDGTLGREATDVEYFAVSFYLAPKGNQLPVAYHDASA